MAYDAAPISQRLEILLGIGEKLFSKRGSLLTTWQALADNFYPERGEFTQTAQDGDTFADNLYDSTPVLFRRDLGNNLSSALRPAGAPWFAVRTGDKDIDDKVENRVWLDNATRILRRIYYATRSGTVEALKQCDHDFVTFGNGVITDYARPDRSYFTTRNHHLKDVVWLDNEDGEVDHVQHKFQRSGRDIERRWPKTVCQQIKDANKKDSTIEYPVQKIVCPADEYYGETPRRGGKRRLPFVELWICMTSKSILEEIPRPEMNYLIPRWHKLSGSQYAVSPAALVALPDARMIQSMKRTILEAAEKSVDPPLIATEEAVQGGINIQAGGVTWVDRDYDENLGQALRALELGKNPLLGIELVRDVRDLLANAWFINKLALPSDKEMTAYEAGLRMKEYARAAMPVFEPFGPGYSSLILDLKFRMGLRLGMFGSPSDIPSDLRGREVGFQYTTPVEESEGRALVFAFREATEITLAANGIKPDVSRNVDIDRATRDAIRGTGAPAPWLVDEKEIEKMDQQGGQGPSPADLSGVADLVTKGAGTVKSVADAEIAFKKANAANGARV